MNNISIIIITKNRAAYLNNCLLSLKGQLTRGDEIFVVLDSESSDGSEKILLKLKRVLPIAYYKSDIRGFPENFNLGIRKSKRDILVFINDDCVVRRDFVRMIKRAHTVHPDSVIQGMTFSLPQNNIYAEVAGDNYTNWLTVHQRGDVPGFMDTIDNKNVSIPRRVFGKIGYYNEKLTKGSEDIEFGFRLVKAGIPIILDSSVVVYHFERETFRGFIKQHIRFGISEAALDRTLSPTEKISAIQWRKLFLHAKRAAVRESRYWKQHRYGDFVLLPFLYVLLFFVRIYAYYGKSA